MSAVSLEIVLFGPCIVRTTARRPQLVTGNKHRALFALLATSPTGARTRAFVQDMLWGQASFDGGRQSLRRALSDIRKRLGSSFDDVVTVTHSDVSLRLSAVRIIGGTEDGPFLDGVDGPEPAFCRWLAEMRRRPGVGRTAYGGPVAGLDLKPAIAVIPFQLVCGDADHRPIGDWLAVDVSRALSRTSLLFVVSHLSSREIAGRELALSSIRRDLGVDLCVTGSIRIAGDAIIADVDLCDTRNGRILLTRRFEDRIADLAGLNSALTFEMVRSISRAITDDAVSVACDRQLSGIEDHRLLLSGVGLMHRPTMAGFRCSRSFFEEAIRRVPGNGEAYAWLAKWYVLNVFNGWSVDTDADTRRAREAAATAIARAPSNAFCLTIDGFVHNNLLRRPDIALERYAAALDADPNEALAWLLKGAHHAFTDEGALAVEHVERACRLSPLDPFKPYFQSLSATAHFASGNDRQALSLWTRLLRSTAATPRPFGYGLPCYKGWVCMRRPGTRRERSWRDSRTSPCPAICTVTRPPSTASARRWRRP